MIEIAKFLDLPRFPDITEDCYLHPNILCMKYLMEVNLPGKCVGYVVRKLLSNGRIIMNKIRNPLKSLTIRATDRVHSNMKLNFTILS